MKLDEEAYDAAQLEWFDLYRGILKAGQLLASFELLEASQTLDLIALFMHCLQHFCMVFEYSFYLVKLGVICSVSKFNYIMFYLPVYFCMIYMLLRYSLGLFTAK